MEDRGRPWGGCHDGRHRERKALGRLSHGRQREEGLGRLSRWKTERGRHGKGGGGGGWQELFATVIGDKLPGKLPHPDRPHPPPRPVTLRVRLCSVSGILCCGFSDDDMKIWPQTIVVVDSERQSETESERWRKKRETERQTEIERKEERGSRPTCVLV